MSAPGEDQCGGGDDLERLIKCAEVANELAVKLEELLQKGGAEIRIEGLSTRQSLFYFEKFWGSVVEIDRDRRQLVIWVPASLAKNWGYLSDHADIRSGHVERVRVRILRQLTVGDLLMLYRMYEEGLLSKIAADAERGIEEMKKFEKMLRKASAIAEMMGIPPA